MRQLKTHLFAVAGTDGLCIWHELLLAVGLKDCFPL